jgi:DNA-binding NtrC family response regulator
MSEHHARLLVVDDEPVSRHLLARHLARGGYADVALAEDGEAAFELLRARSFDLVLLDVMMPGLDGFTVCERLRGNEATRGLPVIFLTSLDDPVDKVRAFSAGAVDYLTKPFRPEELLARVGTHLSLLETRRALQEQNARLREEIEAHQRTKVTIECLVDEIQSRANFRDIVGESAAFRQVLEQVDLVAPTGSTVLILGETGTGKELIARAIHNRSTRRDRPLIKINCASLPRELVESELFGHEKGAFTGATQQRRGRFELADGGTLFLDEVSELPLESQAKLLRVLQEQEFERVGGSRSLRTDVRLIAATNRDLQQHVKAGFFRADLYYRLNVFPVELPSLRERREDIPRLMKHFTLCAARKLGKRIDDIAPAVLEEAMAYDWPGNVRELENLVERAAILTRGPVLDRTCLIKATPGLSEVEPAPQAKQTLEEIERSHILRVLEHTRGVIEGELGAARILGLNPSTLRGRLRKLGINKRSEAPPADA